jgi:hypothetical protein
LPVGVDWSAWPKVLAKPAFSLEKLKSDWRDELRATIHCVAGLPSASATLAGSTAAVGSPWEPCAPGRDWTDLSQFLEKYEHHARIYEDT